MPKAKRSKRAARPARSRAKSRKTRALAKPKSAPRRVAEPVDPRIQQQLKLYEEGMRCFSQQKFHRAKQAFEKVIAGFGKELADRARVHLAVCEQRISRAQEPSLRSADDHYHGGIAMMNLGRWDEAREHLDRAKKLAAKADYVFYALAALDCLTGEADSALQNLRTAIELKPENRYHARNDEDFKFLNEDPRFTDLIYPERESP
jgi:tetratricopeptide (TPR) repeat protein